MENPDAMKNFVSTAPLTSRARINTNLLKKLRQRAEFNRRGGKNTPPEFKKPLFIVSAPRAGSTLLFEILSALPDVWTTGAESHELIEGIPRLHPRGKNYASNVLTKKDYSPETAKTLRSRFAMDIFDRDGRRYPDLPENQMPLNARLVEKTPKNALRIPFLKAVFPDARFVFLYRDPKENIASLMEGWKSKRFIAYRHLPRWPGKPWSFLLVPGWHSLQKASIAEIAAYQWKTANQFIVNSLKTLPASSWFFATYKELTEETEKTMGKISAFARLKIDARVKKLLEAPLPLSAKTLSPPSPYKWKKYEEEIRILLPGVSSVADMIKTDMIKADRVKKGDPS
jgi:hypothetical protein